jgi:hypothetical protein
MMQPHGRTFWTKTLAWAVFLICLLVVFPRSIERQGDLGIDFPIFYSAAAHHGDAEGYIYPPFLAWAISPLTLLTMRGASMVWYAVQGAAILWVLWICIPLPDWSDRRRLAIAAVYLVATVRLVILNAELGQVNGLLLLLVLIAARIPGTQVAGSTLGLAAIVKLSPLIVLPFSLLDKRGNKKAFLGAFLATICLCALLPHLAGYDVSGLTRLLRVQHTAGANIGLLEYLGYASYLLYLVLLLVSVLVAARAKSRREIWLIPIVLIMVGPGFVRKAHLIWGVLLGPLVNSPQARLVSVPLLWAIGSLGTMAIPETALAGNFLALLLLLFDVWKVPEEPHLSPSSPTATP